VSFVGGALVAMVKMSKMLGSLAVDVCKPFAVVETFLFSLSCEMFSIFFDPEMDRDFQYPSNC